MPVVTGLPSAPERDHGAGMTIIRPTVLPGSAICEPLARARPSLGRLAPAIRGCAVAFGPRGLLGTRILLDDAARTAAELEAAVRERHPEMGALPASTPTGRAARDIARLVRHLDHGDGDLQAIEIDWHGASDFRVRVSALARTIGAGRVRTYGDLARELGSSARAVGRAMATNPFPIVVPCHRVVAAHGLPGGFTAPGGLDTKDALLRLEGGSLAPAPTQLSLYRSS